MEWGEGDGRGGEKRGEMRGDADDDDGGDGCDDDDDGCDDDDGDCNLRCWNSSRWIRSSPLLDTLTSRTMLIPHVIWNGKDMLSPGGKVELTTPKNKLHC